MPASTQMQRDGILSWIAVIALLFTALATSGEGRAQVLSGSTRDLLPELTPEAVEHWGDSVWQPQDPVVWKIVDRLEKIVPTVFYEFSRGNLPVDSKAWELGHIFRVAGNVLSIERINAESVDDDGDGDGDDESDGESEDSSPDHFFLVDVGADDGERCRLVCFEVPSAISTIREPEVSAHGFYLGMIRVDESNELIPLIAARQLGWHPRPSETSVAGQAALGAEGVDAGLLEHAVGRNGQNLDHTDTLAILQLLSAAGEAASRVESPLPLDVVSLLRRPTTNPGECFEVQATIDRITKIDLSTQPLAVQMGIENYYQLDVHVAFGQRRMNVKVGDSDETLQFDNQYPVTMIVRQLPETLQPGSRQNAQILTRAFYYRMWSHASIKSKQIDPSIRQVVPILVADTPQLLAVSYQSFSTMITIIVISGLVVLLAAAWLFSRSSGAAGRDGRAAHPLPDSIEWEAIADQVDPSSRSGDK